ncbi:MAG: GNAT family N-acetyltransferase [Sphingobium sp.]
MFARTPRLLLRPGWMEDAAALTAAIGDEAVLRNLARAPSPYGIDDARNFLSQPQDIRLPRLLVFTRTQGTPRLVGGCELQREEDGGVEIGYWIARPYWGLGFATEAASAVLAMGRASGITGVRARHFIDNPASGHVLRKIGFRSTGRIERRWSAWRNAEADSLLFEEGEGRYGNDDPATLLYRDAAPALAA